MHKEKSESVYNPKISWSGLSFLVGHTQTSSNDFLKIYFRGVAIKKIGSEPQWLGKAI